LIGGFSDNGRVAFVRVEGVCLKYTRRSFWKISNPLRWKILSQRNVALKSGGTLEAYLETRESCFSENYHNHLDLGASVAVYESPYVGGPKPLL